MDPITIAAFGIAGTVFTAISAVRDFYPFLRRIGKLFKKKPKPSNDTLQQIQIQVEQLQRDASKRFEAEEEFAAYKRQAEDEQAARTRAEAVRLQHELDQQSALAAYRHKAELDQAAALRREDELAASFRADAERRASIKREEDHQAEMAATRLQAELDKADALHQADKRAASLASQKREEEHASKLRKAENHLAAMKLKAEEDRVAHQQREQAAKQEAQAAKVALQQGLQPVEWPTKHQYGEALKRIKYDPEKCHFAVCGTSGSGKSSLVNALRGLTNKDESSAKVGVTETTAQIGRYPDPRHEYPFSRFVWYDIPGAGTLNVSDWQYFNCQGLFVFDFIIVVYDVRFTKIDVGIIENCCRFKIPVFIVRSKADQHVANMASEEDDVEPGDSEYERVYQEKLTKFILQTRSDFFQQLDKMKAASKKKELDLDQSDSKYFVESHFEFSYQEWLSKQVVYIVSAKRLRSLLLNDNINRQTYIDEVSLFQSLLTTASCRRYTPKDLKEDEGLFTQLGKSTSAMIGRQRLPLSFHVRQ